MKEKNKVYIGTSLDGYIADKNGALDWLDSIPNPNGESMGYFEFMSGIDALVMGRTTFETVCGFDVEWPYQKPVFVLSNSLTEIQESHKDKAFLVKGDLKEVLAHIHEKGYKSLYIDGGRTIQNFLKEDLIDEITITTIPILLGGGFSLFGELNERQMFELVESKVYLDQIVQSHFKRKR